MDVILIPGFWLRAESWTEVLPPLEAAGHRVHPVTRLGLREGDDPAAVSLEQQIEALVEFVDTLEGPVALVGHSGGGPVAYGVADRRVDRIAQLVFVDTIPLPEGAAINTELTIVNGTAPLPEWSELPDEDLRDLDEAARARFRARAVPEPAGTTSDPQRLSDERRRTIPATVIATAAGEAEFRRWFEAPSFAELAALESLRFIELPTGHWPQFTRPRELGEAIVSALG